MPTHLYRRLSLALLAGLVILPSLAAESSDSDPYQPGKSWSGAPDENKGNVRSIWLKARKEDRVNFVFEGAVGNARWRASGLLNKGLVTLDKLDRVVDPNHHEAVVCKNVTGNARINSDGTLDFQVKANASGDGPNNRPISVTFRHAKPS
jgi:hypothetical protein